MAACLFPKRKKKVYLSPCVPDSKFTLLQQQQADTTTTYRQNYLLISELLNLKKRNDVVKNIKQIMVKCVCVYIGYFHVLLYEWFPTPGPRTDTGPWVN